MTKVPIKSPKKSESELRTERLNIRLTPSEYEKLSRKADEHSLPMATFLRDRILELSPPVERVHDLPKVDRELIRQINGIGNNINQITKNLNSQIAEYRQFDIVTLHQQLARIADVLENIERHYTAK